MFLYVKRQKIEIREAKKAKPLNLCSTIDISIDTAKIHINIDTDMNIKRNNKSISYINISMKVYYWCLPPSTLQRISIVFAFFASLHSFFCFFNYENTAFFAFFPFFAFFRKVWGWDCGSGWSAVAPQACQVQPYAF